MTRPFQKSADYATSLWPPKAACSEIAQAQAPREDTQKVNAEIPETVYDNYTNVVKQYLPDNIVSHIDNSDVIKPCGRAFEGLSRVRDGSKSTAARLSRETATMSSKLPS